MFESNSQYLIKLHQMGLDCAGLLFIRIAQYDVVINNRANACFPKFMNHTRKSSEAAYKVQGASSVLRADNVQVMDDVILWKENFRRWGEALRVGICNGHIVELGFKVAEHMHASPLIAIRRHPFQ